MKKIILLLVALFAINNLSAKEINGDTLSVNGIKVIRLNGTHEERGYTYGRLLANEIYDIYFNYFREELKDQGLLMFYSMLLSQTLSKISVDDRIEQEAQAIVEGIQDSEHAAKFNAIWGRNFTKEDLIFSNLIVELYANLGCSALMSWGEATMQDPELMGELIITRHLDWFDNEYLYNNHLIAAHNPSEPDEQRWVSFGLAGLFGVLSGANESGVGVFQHMGNTNYYDDENFEPIFFTLRKTIERKDLDGDNKSNTQDVWHGINNVVQGGPFIIDVVGARKNLDSAYVIECSGMQKAARSLGENSNIAGTNLVATNHFRVLDVAEECFRYNNMQFALNIDSMITIEKSWDYLKQGAGLTNNLQVIQYIPASNDFLIGFTDDFDFGWDQDPFRFNFEDLFKPSSVVEPKNNIAIAGLSPNPANIFTQVSFTLESDSPVELDLVSASGKTVKKIDLGFNIAGENTASIDLSDVDSGVYFVKISTNNSSFTNKIVVVR